MRILIKRPANDFYIWSVTTMINARVTSSKLAQIGESTLEGLKRAATAPDNNKQLRTFGTSDAIKLIGCSKSSLHDAEKAGKTPKPEYILQPGHKRATKQYSLNNINIARKFFNTLPSKPKSKETPVISVIGFKGGIGKSTYSTNLQQDLALRGYKVLAIDMDNQGTLTHNYGLIPDLDLGDSDTLHQFLVNETDTIEPLIRKTYWPNIDLIPANLSLYNAEFQLPVMHTISQLKSAVPELTALLEKNNLSAYTNISNFEFYSRLKAGLDTIKNNYDIVIIDCPPSMGMLTINSLFASQGLVIPVVPAMTDYASTVQFFKMLDEIFNRFPEQEYAFIKLQVNRYVSTSKSTDNIDEIIRHYYGAFVNSHFIPESEVIRKVALSMQNLFEIKNYGDKSTLDRVIEPAMASNDEILKEIKRFWGEINSASIISETTEDSAHE